MTAMLSVRVEFFGQVDHEHGWRGLRAGSAVQEDAFKAVAVPRVGELVSAIRLFGHELARLIQPRDAGSFVRAGRVEHCPISLPGDGRTLTTGIGRRRRRYSSFSKLRRRASNHSITSLNEGLRARGWEVWRA